MYQTINFSQFVDAFVARERQYKFATHYEDGYVGWYEGLRVLFDYLEEVNDEAYELDVIALCCYFSHDTALEIANSYGIDVEGMDEADRDDAIREYLDDEGMMIGETEYGFVYRQY
jgi:hypothetical protein